MRIQSERDRIELRIVETKLKEMTKDRDSFKDKYMLTCEQLNEVENNLIDVKYEYDELMKAYNRLLSVNDRVTMEEEDFRSNFVRYDDKFKELKAWEKKLRKLEKDLRSIKKRTNPYEYVDFSDQSCQTSNPTRERGVNTDELIFGYAPKHKEKIKSNIRTSFADTVTTVLGGIPMATETITDIDIDTPKDQVKQLRSRLPFQLKARPQSSHLMGTTYSYNLKNGIIEEEDDPLGLNNFATMSKDLFQTTSSIKLKNFHSPSASRPTALQRHKKAYKTHYEKKHEGSYSNVFEHRAKTAMSGYKERDKKSSNPVMKSIYIHTASNSRPMTEQPGQRQHKGKMMQRREDSQKQNKSRPVSQDPTMSKTGTHVSANHRNYVTRCKSSLRNLIKAASTRNEQ